MHSDYHWHPLALPDTSLTRAGWFLLQGTLRVRQPRGETRLRWQCSEGTWHEQVLPITRRGTLQELVWLPVGACQVALPAASLVASSLIRGQLVHLQILLKWQLAR